MELLTIPFSHYNDRARWALAHHGVAVRERRFLPGFHAIGVRRATRPENRRGDRTGSPLATPVLVTDDGEVLPSSGEILAWVDERFGTPETTLYPEPHREAIAELEAPLHDVVGVATRRIAYYHLLPRDELFGELVRHNVGLGQRALFGVARPAVKRMLSKRFGGRSGYERALGRLREQLALLDARLHGGGYLVGDRFTAADLTLAAMLAPVLLPLPQYGAYLPAPTESEADDFAELIDEVRGTEAGRHAVRMYREHRPPPPEGWVLG